jgi:hypothetical protein
MKCSLQTIKLNLKNPRVLSWLLISVTLMYVYLSVFLEFNDWMMWVYIIFLLPLMVGLYHIVNEEKASSVSFIWDYKNGLFAFFGILLTYVMSLQLDLSAVIASSFIGLVGYILFKKYSVAIYAGSFAGMVSSYLFDYYQVIAIAFLMGILFVFFQKSFKGLGGKLGTTAFISTILVSLLFQRDFLIVTNDLNFIRLIIISLLGALVSYAIQHYLKQSPVLASSLPSLIYALIVIYLIEDYITCTVVFFSASFIGMSSKERLPNIIYVIIAGFIHAFLFHFYFEHFNGLGGKLGLMALTSVVMTLGIRYMYLYFKGKINIRKV